MRRTWLGLLLLALAARAQELKFPADRPFDLRHLRLEGSISLPHRTLRATAKLEMTALRATSVLRLDAVGLMIEGVQVLRGDPLQPQVTRFVHDGERLEIALPQAVLPGERVTVQVSYRCEDPESGLHFFGPTEAEPEVPWQVWSQGETLGTRHWIPIFDQPNERLTSELIITADEGLQVLSNGSCVAVVRNPDRTETWHWSQEKDHVPYLITLVVGRFAITTELWRGKLVDYWVPPDRAQDTLRSFADTKRMLDFFSERTGVVYPWVKYTQVVVEQFAFGGMENTSATTLNERTLHDERAHLDFSSEGLVAHELAHQWYGDLITCADWAHTWLNEGFATYFEALWSEHDDGRDAFLYNMLGKMRSALDGGKKLPIIHRAYDGPWQQFDARSYPKGAWVLHMLRRRLGDEAFFRAVRHYTRKHAHDCVETHDLRRAFEDVTGVALGRFFYDWTERPGHPVAEVRHDWDGESGVVRVRVAQKQKEEAFHFPLRLEYRFAGDVAPVAVVQEVTAKQVDVALPLPARPTLARVDPENAVLMELTEVKGRDLWVRQLLEDSNPLLRIRAAEHFGGSRRDPDRRLLADALGREPFWAVQAEIAKALGRTGGTLARDTLLQALSLEHPKARREVVAALAKFHGDATVRDAMEGLVRHGDPSYSVEAEAIAAWAAHRPEAALDLLKKVLERDSHREALREAALKSRGILLDPNATGLLIGWSRRGKPRACRRAALEALGTLAGAGRWNDAQIRVVVETCIECLATPEHRSLKTEAARTLRILGEAAYPALVALDALAAHDPHDNVRRQAREAADRIRSGAPPQLQLQRLQEELRSLRESLRQLQSRLERKQ